MRCIGPLADPNGHTLYTKYAGFSPVECSELPGITEDDEEPHFWNQSVAAYRDAVIALRSTPLATLPTHHKSDKLLQNLLARYGGNEQENIATAADLVQLIYTRARTDQSAEKRAQASNDLSQWYKNLLKLPPLSRQSIASRPYWQAVQTLDHTQLFVRFNDS